MLENQHKSLHKNPKYYDPKTVRFPYPEQTDQHYLPLKKDKGIEFDENYPYWDTRFFPTLIRGLVRILLYIIVFPLNAIRVGLRIKGRENLKKHKRELADGCVTVSNHIHMWDFISNMNALLPHKAKIIAWDKNINGENGGLIRAVGGIPIPTKNLKGSKVFSQTVEKILENKGWIHVYSEGSMWEYYAPIRPFKLGAAYFAIKTGKPIVPIGFSYRKPSWWRKLIKQPACITLTIGEPIYPDMSLGLLEAEKDLTIRTHRAVCLLAGINPDDNPYGPIFEKDTRVDYYATEYGKGYKGSF